MSDSWRFNEIQLNEVVILSFVSPNTGNFPLKKKKKKPKRL